MSAFTASSSKNMESLFAGGPGWQVLRESGRQAGGGFSTLAGQNMDEWGWALVLMWISWPLIFRKTLCYGISGLVS
jgi:hypothetical protein